MSVPRLIMPTPEKATATRIYIVGTGPSLDLLDPAELDGQIVIALNEAALYLGEFRCDAIACVDSPVLYGVHETTSKWAHKPVWLVRKSFMPALKTIGAVGQDMNALTRARDIQTGSSAYQYAYELYRVLQTDGRPRIKAVHVVGVDMCEILPLHRDVVAEVPVAAAPPAGRRRKRRDPGSGEPQTVTIAGKHRSSYRYARCMRPHLPATEKQAHGDYHKRALVLPLGMKGVAVPSTGTSRVRQLKQIEIIAQTTKLRDILNYSLNLTDHRKLRSNNSTLNFQAAFNNIHPDIALGKPDRYKRVNWEKLRRQGVI